MPVTGFIYNTDQTQAALTSNRILIQQEKETNVSYQAEILEDREKTYGDPVVMHERIAKIWSAILKTEVTAFQVALCMTGMKLARAEQNPDHKDSLIDTLGYAEIATIIQKRHNESKK